jgi:putative hydrolase of the HAD superfamily
MPFDPSRVDCWIFDLDNTLYPASTCLFDQIDLRMGMYIADLLGCDHAEARRVQKMYFHDHGTTLAGLMHFHGWTLTSSSASSTISTWPRLPVRRACAND